MRSTKSYSFVTQGRFIRVDGEPVLFVRNIPRPDAAKITRMIATADGELQEEGFDISLRELKTNGQRYASEYADQTPSWSAERGLFIVRLHATGELEGWGRLAS